MYERSRVLFVGPPLVEPIVAVSRLTLRLPLQVGGLTPGGPPRPKAVVTRFLSRHVPRLHRPVTYPPRFLSGPRGPEELTRLFITPIYLFPPERLVFVSTTEKKLSEDRRSRPLYAT